VIPLNQWVNKRSAQVEKNAQKSADDQSFFPETGMVTDMETCVLRERLPRFHPEYVTLSGRGNNGRPKSIKIIG
jgi:hypothetical protein